MNHHEKYIECGGVFCPYCGSHDIEGDSFESDEYGVTQVVGCNECHEEWKDTYTLTQVVPVSNTSE